MGKISHQKNGFIFKVHFGTVEYDSNLNGKKIQNNLGEGWRQVVTSQLYWVNLQIRRGPGTLSHLAGSEKLFNWITIEFSRQDRNDPYQVFLHSPHWVIYLGTLDTKLTSVCFAFVPEYSKTQAQTAPSPHFILWCSLFAVVLLLCHSGQIPSGYGTCSSHAVSNVKWEFGRRQCQIQLSDKSFSPGYIYQSI